MEEDNESKKRFFGAVSWLIIVAYLILNIALMTGDTSLEVQVVTLPLLISSLLSHGFSYGRSTIKQAVYRRLNRIETRGHLRFWYLRMAKVIVRHTRRT